MPTSAQIDDFITALTQAHVAADACNQYAAGNANNAIRRHNLRLYLREMSARNPDSLLLMEAPGYRGCRLTGIPVTSRKIMLAGAPDLNMFGQDAGFRDSCDAGFERVYGEQSATILWRTLGGFTRFATDMERLPLPPA